MSRKKLNPHQEMLAARRRRDAEIVRRAWKETQEAIAADLGMTRQRVGQIIKAAKERETATNE